MLTNNYNKNHELDICPLIVKKLFLYKDYDYLITKFIPSLPYKTNGLYFNSLNTKHANQLYLFKNNNNNKDKSQKKFKEKEKPNIKKDDSIVLKIDKTEKSDIYNLFCKNREELKLVGIAHIASLRTSKLIRKLFTISNDDTDSEDILVNCKYNEKFKKYEPISKAETHKITDFSVISAK